MKNVAVYVARKYGGIKMGSVRFYCYLRATKNVIEAATGKTNLILRKEKKDRQTGRTRLQNNPNSNNTRGREINNRGRGGPRGGRGNQTSYNRGPTSTRGNRSYNARGVGGTGRASQRQNSSRYSEYFPENDASQSSSPPLFSDMLKQTPEKRRMAMSQNHSTDDGEQPMNYEYDFAQPTEVQEVWSEDRTGEWGQNNNNPQTLAKDVE